MKISTGQLFIRSAAKYSFHGLPGILNAHIPREEQISNLLGNIMSGLRASDGLLNLNTIPILNGKN